MIRKYLVRLSEVFLIFFIVAVGVNPVVAVAGDSKKSNCSSCKKRKAVNSPEFQGKGRSVNNFRVKVFIDNRSQYPIRYMPNDYRGFNKVFSSKNGSGRVPGTEFRPGSLKELGVIKNSHLGPGVELMTPLQFRLPDAVNEMNREYSFSPVFFAVDGKNSGKESVVQWRELSRESGSRRGPGRTECLEALLKAEDAPVKWKIKTDRLELGSDGYYAEYTIIVLNSSEDSLEGIRPELLTTDDVWRMRDAEVKKEVSDVLHKRYGQKKVELDEMAEKLSTIVKQRVKGCVKKTGNKVSMGMGPTEECRARMREVAKEMAGIIAPEREKVRTKVVRQTDGSSNTSELAENKRRFKSSSFCNKLGDRVLNTSKYPDDFDSSDTKIKAYEGRYMLRRNCRPI